MDDAKLIDFVRHFNITYLPRNERAAAWEQLSDEMQMDAEGCRTRWRSLRDTFRRHYKAGSLERWKHYRRMKFLMRTQIERENKVKNNDNSNSNPPPLLQMMQFKTDPELDLNSTSYDDAYDSDEYFPQDEKTEDGKPTVVYDTVQAQMSPVTIDASMSPVNVDDDDSPPPRRRAPARAIIAADEEGHAIYNQALPPPPLTQAPVEIRTADKSKETRRSKNSVRQEMLNMLSLVGEQLSCKPEKMSSTRQLFESLATKIEDAQLPLTVLNRLEMDMLKLVHKVLEENS